MHSHFFYWNGPNRHDLWENEQEIWRYGKFFVEESLKEAKKFVDANLDKSAQNVCSLCFYAG